MFTRRQALVGATLAAMAADRMPVLAAATETDIKSLPRQKVALVNPPFVHDHEQTAQGDPRIVEFTMPIEEKQITLDDEGTTFQAMTYNGSIPGPLMVVHEGDYLELTLINPESNTLAHNIDFHAATGALGGGALTLINPGEQVKLRFKATRAGVFVYHCAPGGEMIPWHVVSGMSGVLMVLPRDGLKDDKGKPVRYDRVYYIGESDFYVPRDEKGAFKAYESAGDSYADTVEVMKRLIPSHVVFNGAKGSLTGDKAMKGKVGETVLIVHSQANRDTRPHLIGGHGDYVWEQGKFNNPPAKDLETWFIRGGSAGAALYTFRQPGVYAYVNHNLIEAVLLGATAHFVVEGTWNDDLMNQVEAPRPISVNCGDDIMTGGLGDDSFVFSTPLVAGNVDIIRDFVAVDDTIRLANSVFKVFSATGALSAADFASHIVYNSATGALSYDADGVGVGSAATRFATLDTGLALTRLDFLVI